jgi:hypothetical protein
LTVSSEERVSQKAVQIMAGALMLLVWGIWGASAIPTPRLEGLVNYPNPFNPLQTPTYIAYTLERDSAVIVRLFDLGGEPVREWNFGAGENGGRRGENKLSWNGVNEDGERVAAGGYVCQVIASDEAGLIQGVRKIGVVR